MAFSRTRENRKIDDFLRDEAHTVGLVASGLRMRGVTEEALDEAVHERADNVSSSASEWASEDVNNSHIERQVAFILLEDGKEEGKKAIEAAAVEWLASNAKAPGGP